MQRLLEDDEAYLREKGYRYGLVPDSGGACLVIEDYPVNPARYDRSATTLMVRIPDGYNNAALDMFYVDPPLRLRNGEYPDRASSFEMHGGRQWQRFSRHLPVWRPGVDGLPTMLTFVHRELQANG